MAKQKPTLHIYARVSSSTQAEEGTSLETQVELGIERAEKLGFNHKIWNEGAQSSANDDLINRPVLTNLLKDVDDGLIKHLYVWNTDRLSRNQNTWGMIRYKLIQGEVSLHTPTGEQILSDPQTNLMLGIMSELSQYDNQLRTERFRIGKWKRVQSGGWLGGPPPYGYILEDGKLVPNAEEAKWVKKIFEKYADGSSVDDIRNYLLSNGVITRRGNPVWSHGSINALLRNTHYDGYYTYTDKKAKKTLRVTCERLLEPSLIKSVKSAISSRQYKRSGTKRVKGSTDKHIYLLNELLVCGACGSGYGGSRRSTQNDYYSCLSKTAKYKTSKTDKYVNCPVRRNLAIEETDETVWNAVVEVLSKSHLFKEEIKNQTLGAKSLHRSTKDIAGDQKKLARLEKDIAKVRDSIVNLNAEKLIGNVEGSDLVKVIEKLEDHRLSLEAESEELTNSIKLKTQDRAWVDWVGDFGRRIDKLRDRSSIPVQEQKEFLSGIVKNITVTQIDTQRTSLEIALQYPYVGDGYSKSKKGKKSGYKLIDGSPELKVEIFSKRGAYKKKDATPVN